MKIKWVMTVVLAVCTGYGQACTNLIVGKKASADGSVIVSYSADDFGSFGYLRHWAAGKHAKGTMRPVYNWENNNYAGEIEEAPETYNVIGNMNEYQLTITETTFGGRAELVDSTGLLDYGSLIYITLQRAKTAKEAIKVMTDLINQYGYNSEGESFTIADKNEAWVMDLIGKGTGRKGAVWVAVRVPDDCICAHANQSRIRRFPLRDKENCLYSKNVISFAREKGYFKGKKDSDFSFADAYAPADNHLQSGSIPSTLICRTFLPPLISVLCVFARHGCGASLTATWTEWRNICHTLREKTRRPNRCRCLSSRIVGFPCKT